jgi:hypothetical protein
MHIGAQPIPKYGGPTDADDDGAGDPCLLEFLDRGDGISSSEMPARAVIEKDRRLRLGSEDKIDTGCLGDLAASRFMEGPTRQRSH